MKLTHLAGYGLALLAFSTAAQPVKHEITYALIDAARLELTEAQFEPLADKLVGQRVAWTGKVLNVSQNTLNPLYAVQMNMDSGPGFDVSFDVDQQTALQLKKGSSYKFEGTIKTVSTIFGTMVISLQDVRFL